MLRRFLCVILSIAFVFIICSSYLFASAVAPIALVEAALMSYVATTGFKLWVDNGTGQDVMDSLSALYDDWLLSVSGGYLTLEDMSQNNLVYNDTSGNIIISKTAATSFQAFSDWLQSHYNIPTDGTLTTIVSGDLMSGGGYPTNFIYTDYSNFPFAIATSSLSLDVYGGSRRVLRTYSLPSACYGIGLIADNTYVPIVVSDHSFTLTPHVVVYESGSVILEEDESTVSSRSITVSGVNYYAWYGDAISVSNATIASNFPSYCSSIFTISNRASDLVRFIWGAGSPNVVSGLGASLAAAVADVVSSVGDDESLVMDVGAAAGSTVSDIVDSVVSGYDSLTGELPVTDSVVATDVIDTPVQPYPDVDNLGLPDLGLALTTRFPFSIPWDIASIYSCLSHEAVPPVKEFQIIPQSVLTRWGISADTTIRIDLTDQKYSVLLAIIHWSSIIGFCFALAVMTKRYVWTTGG